MWATHLFGLFEVPWFVGVLVWLIPLVIGAVVLINKGFMDDGSDKRFQLLVALVWSLILALVWPLVQWLVFVGAIVAALYAVAWPFVKRFNDE